MHHRHTTTTGFPGHIYHSSDPSFPTPHIPDTTVSVSDKKLADRQDYMHHSHTTTDGGPSGRTYHNSENTTPGDKDIAAVTQRLNAMRNRLRAATASVYEPANKFSFNHIF
jgi:hypothetical protein